MELSELLNRIKENRDWYQEIADITKIIEALEEKNQTVSVRSLAQFLGQSKSYVGVSLQLAYGLRVYPEMRYLKTRNLALQFLLKKRKQIR